MLARALGGGAGEEGSGRDDVDEMRSMLQRSLQVQERIDGTELRKVRRTNDGRKRKRQGMLVGGRERRADQAVANDHEQLVRDKWGASYDVRLSKMAGRFGKKRVYLQVMWKFLEQKSFPLSEEEYMAQLEAVAEYLNIWGVADLVRREIKTTKQQMHLSTVGAKCISIPLIDADRLEQEW